MKVMKEMNVKEFLKNIDYNAEIKVFQEPIKEIDSCPALVKRYQGKVIIALDSNQNYLNFEIRNWYKDDGYFVFICKANKEQEKAIIDAYKSHI